MVGSARERDGRGAVRRGNETVQVVQSREQVGPLCRGLRGQRGTDQRSCQMGKTACVQMREDTSGFGKQAPGTTLTSLAAR